MKTYVDEPPRDRWATPLPIVRALAQRFAGGWFDLDAAAERRNAKAPYWYTRKLDALQLPWGPIGAVVKHAQRDGRLFELRPGTRATRVFLNPPYRNLDRWVARAIAQVWSRRCEVVVMVLPPGVGTRWRSRLNRECLVEEFEGRIPFDPPPGIENENCNRQGSIVAVVRLPLSVPRLMSAEEARLER